MFNLAKRIWNAEPVVIFTALSAGWAAFVAVAQAAEADIVWGVYAGFAVLIAMLGAFTRTQVSPSPPSD